MYCSSLAVVSVCQIVQKDLNEGYSWPMFAREAWGSYETDKLKHKNCTVADKLFLHCVFMHNYTLLFSL